MTAKRSGLWHVGLTATLWGALAIGCSSGGSGGATGTAGHGGAGAAGTTGNAGTTGAAGAAGTTGSAGTTGGAGTTGEAGAAGTGGAGTTGAAGSTKDGGTDAPSSDAGPAEAGAFTLMTSSLKMVDGGLVFPAASSAPMNQSPALTWSGAPAGKLSYALSMYDATAQNTHWILWDIGPMETMLIANLPRGAMPTIPSGASQMSAFGGTPGYEGPGGGTVNNYALVLWALKVSKLAVGNLTLNAIHSTLLPAQSLGSAQILARGTRSGL